LQATITQPNARARRGRGERTSFKGIGRAIKYLTHYGRQAALPYIFLVIATLSQLAVPHMIRNVIDAVTSGFLADQVLQALDKIPAQFISTALPKILEALKYEPALTLDQLRVTLEADLNNAPQALVTALVAIVVFASCADCSHSCRPFGRRRIPNRLHMTFVTICMPRYRAYLLRITTKIRRAS